MKKIFLTILILTTIASCKNQDHNKKKSDKTKEEVTQTSETDTTDTKDDWTYLFDGSSLDGWRGYNEDSIPPGWTIKDENLTLDTLAIKENDDYEGNRTLIFGKEKYKNFTLYLEWKIPKGANSGIFYHIKEGYSDPSKIAPEYQLIDDKNYADIHDLTAYNKSLGHSKNLSELKPLNRTAADYSMHRANPDKKELNPVGEWNTSKIIFTPDSVEHWLNGKKVVSFEPWSEDWYKRKDKSKWKDNADYGKFKEGYIGLQYHASPISFRTIKIKKL